jgi:hypothetical protein
MAGRDSTFVGRTLSLDSQASTANIPRVRHPIALSSSRCRRCRPRHQGTRRPGDRTYPVSNDLVSEGNQPIRDQRTGARDGTTRRRKENLLEVLRVMSHSVVRVAQDPSQCERTLLNVARIAQIVHVTHLYAAGTLIDHVHQFVRGGKNAEEAIAELHVWAPFACERPSGMLRRYFPSRDAIHSTVHLRPFMSFMLVWHWQSSLDFLSHLDSNRQRRTPRHVTRAYGCTSWSRMTLRQTQ